MENEALTTTPSDGSISPPDHKRKIYDVDSDVRQPHSGDDSNSEPESLDDDDTTGESEEDDVENGDEVVRDVKRPRLDGGTTKSDGSNSFLVDEYEYPKGSMDVENNTTEYETMKRTKGSPGDTKHGVDMSSPKEIGNAHEDIPADENIDTIKTECKNESGVESKEDISQMGRLDDSLFKEEVTKGLAELAGLDKGDRTQVKTQVTVLKKKEVVTSGENINEFGNMQDIKIENDIVGVATEGNGCAYVEKSIEKTPVSDAVLLGKHENPCERSLRTEIAENTTYFTEKEVVKGLLCGDGHQNSSVQPSSGSSQHPEAFMESHNFGDDRNTTIRKMEVPRDKVGVLIGKGGDNIRYLQQNSGAKIQIARDTDPNSYSFVREVDIIGSFESINKAEKLIKDVITEAEAGGSPSFVARSGATTHVSCVTEQMQMQVPNEKVGVIIGKGGEMIKGLQSKSGARIQVLIPQHLPEGDQSKERVVRVTGDKKQIEIAREMINEVMNQPSRPPATGGYRPQGNRPRPSNFSPQWGPSGSLPANPTANHHRPPLPHHPQYCQPSYPGYPPQQGPANGGFTPTWEQQRPPSAAPVQHFLNQDFYGQPNSVDTQSSNYPAPSPANSTTYPPPAYTNYPYANQPQPASCYGQPPSQHNYPSGGYEEPKYDTQGRPPYHGVQQPQGNPNPSPYYPLQRPTDATSYQPQFQPPQPYAMTGPVQQTYPPPYGPPAGCDVYNQAQPGSAQAYGPQAYGAPQMGYTQASPAPQVGYYDPQAANSVVSAAGYGHPGQQMEGGYMGVPQAGYTQQAYPQQVYAQQPFSAAPQQLYSQQQQQQGYLQQSAPSNTQQVYPASVPTGAQQQVYSQPVQAGAQQQVYPQSVQAGAQQQVYPQQAVPAGAQAQPVYVQQPQQAVPAGAQAQPVYVQQPQQQVYAQSFMASAPQATAHPPHE